MASRGPINWSSSRSSTIRSDRSRLSTNHEASRSGVNRSRNVCPGSPGAAGGEIEGVARPDMRFIHHIAEEEEFLAKAQRPQRKAEDLLSSFAAFAPLRETLLYSSHLVRHDETGPVLARQEFVRLLRAHERLLGRVEGQL